jgi:hypothetical protein
VISGKFRDSSAANDVNGSRSAVGCDTGDLHGVAKGRDPVCQHRPGPPHVWL